MNILINSLILCLVFFFTACSSKSDPGFNQSNNSISLNKNVPISSVPRTIKSPVSIGLGFGGYLSRHLGIHVGTSYRPTISNDYALKLERALNQNNISLADVVANEFDNMMKNDSFYKDKYVPFGSNYKIYLYIPKYYIDTATFSSKASVKIVITTKIFNEKDELIYENSEENDSLSRYYKYDENEILNSYEILNKVLRDSVRNSIAKIIIDMKKN